MGGRSGSLGIWRAICVTLALGLSGCLVSEGPLISPSEAAFPLADRVSAERFSPSSDNNGWTHQAYDSAYRSGSTYVVKREGSEDETVLTFKRIAPNTFIAQTGGNEAGYMYGLVVLKGDTLYEYDLDCEDFNAAQMQRYGLFKKDTGDCGVTSVQGLAAAYLDQLQSGRRPETAYVLR